MKDILLPPIPLGGWRFQGNLVQGIGFFQLVRYMSRVSWSRRSFKNHPACWMRVAFLVGCSLVNSFLGFLERVYFFFSKVDIESVALPDDPIFVIGHPRTGTTIVHSLLAEDGRFCCVKTLDVAFPTAPILVGRFIPLFLMKWIEKVSLPTTRPMDQLPLTLSTVQEDELATNCLSGGASPYAAISFMDHYEDFLEYLTFENVAARDLADWQRSFKLFLRKLVYMNPGKRPVLKSPCHTARCDLLRKMFPKCSFVWIHRDPLDVIPSSLHMSASYFPCCYLTTPTADDVIGYTMRQHDIVYKALFSSFAFKERKNFVEIRFDQLDSSTVGALNVVKVIYKALGIADPPLERVESFLDDLLVVRKFKKNAHVSYGIEARIRRETKWIRSRLGYFS